MVPRSLHSLLNRCKAPTRPGELAPIDTRRSRSSAQRDLCTGTPRKAGFTCNRIGEGVVQASDGGRSGWPCCHDSVGTPCGPMDGVTRIGMPRRGVPELWFMLLHLNDQFNGPRQLSTSHCSVRRWSRGAGSQCPCSAAKPVPCATASPPTCVRSRAPRAAVVSGESHRMFRLSGDRTEASAKGDSYAV